MDDRKVNSKSHAEEIGAPESTHRNPCSPPDDTGFDNSRENCNSLAAVGFESQRVIASREHDTDNELPRQFNEANEEKRESSEADPLKQGKIESREHDTELPRQFNEEKEEKRESEASHQKRGKIASREHDTELPRKFNEDNEEKRESRQFNEENEEKRESEASHQKQGKYFFYDSPLYEDTGVWIPVSVPPMLESENEEWARGFHSNGGYFPEGDMGWGQYLKEDKELTMWDVVVEMLLAARGKVSAFAKGDIHGCNFSWMSSHLLEQAWQEMAQTLTETNFGNVSELLEAEPPKWLGDSSASACMLCGVRFHPIMCSRHHCRFCGGIFCGECSKGRSLLPAKFRVSDPQRACDVCCVRLESVQPYLMNQVSHAAQLPTCDLTDLSTLRSWVNFPWGQSMENEIYKATNTIRGYRKVGYLKPEKSIPDIILRQAKGLAILSVAKVGVMVTYNIGTGLVIARRDDGSWSPPSAIASFGMGWGAQAGGELTDFIIVLRTNDAVKTFTGNMHISIGAGLSAAVGIVGRAVEADVRAGDGGCAACYTYSCSKGAFVGCSLEGSVFTTRTRQNSRFYGSQSITASDILLGSIPMPPAAAILYRGLADLYQKLEK